MSQEYELESGDHRATVQRVFNNACSEIAVLDCGPDPVHAPSMEVAMTMVKLCQVYIDWFEDPKYSVKRLSTSESKTSAETWIVLQDGNPCVVAFHDTTGALAAAQEHLSLVAGPEAELTIGLD